MTQTRRQGWGTQILSRESHPKRQGLLLEQNHDKRALKRIFQGVDFLENQHSKALTSGIPIVILL